MRRFGKLKLAAVVLLILSIAAVVAVKMEIEPNMESVSKIKAEALVGRTISKALVSQFEKDTSQDELFTIINGEDGSIEMVQANSAAINIFMSQLSVKLQESFQKNGGGKNRSVAGSADGEQIFISDGAVCEFIDSAHERLVYGL